MCDAYSGKHLWMSEHQVPISRETDYNPPGLRVFFDSTGSECVCFEADFVARRRESLTGRMLTEYSVAVGRGAALRGFSPDGETVVMSDGDRGTCFFDRSSGTIIDRIDDPTRIFAGVFRTTLGHVFLETGQSQPCLRYVSPRRLPTRLCCRESWIEQKLPAFQKMGVFGRRRHRQNHLWVGSEASGTPKQIYRTGRQPAYREPLLFARQSDHSRPHQRWHCAALARSYAIGIARVRQQGRANSRHGFKSQRQSPRTRHRTLRASWTSNPSARPDARIFA